MAYSFVGLTLDQARGLAKERQHPFRVVKLDGADLQVTYDFIPGRINAEVVSGIVVAFAAEGGGSAKNPAPDKAVSENCLVFFDGCNQCPEVRRAVLWPVRGKHAPFTKPPTVWTNNTAHRDFSAA